MTEANDESGLYAVELSAGGSAPLVFLHGFGAAAFVWAELQETFAEEHPSLAYDLPGHGLSLGADGIGGAGHMARAIAADLARRGIERAHFVGHSMGGAVAAKIALRDPALVTSMTLLAPGGFGPDINHRLLARYAAAADHDALRAALENMYGWNSPVPERVVAGLVERRSAPGATVCLASILSSILLRTEDGVMQGTIARDALAKLTMPVKVLWGKRDNVVPTGQANGLPPLFAVHLFEQAGHMLIDERPTDVARLIRHNISAADL